MSNLAELPKQRGMQHESSDKAWAIDTREHRGAQMEQAIQDTLGKQRAKKRKTTARLGSIEASPQKPIANTISVSFQSPA